MAQSVDEVVVVPCAFLDTVTDGNFLQIGALQDVFCDPVEDSGVGGSIVFSGTAKVFIEVNIEHPVEAVFDLPVGPCDIERLFGREEAGAHEQTAFRLCLGRGAW